MSGDDFNVIGPIHSRTEDGLGYGLNPMLYQRLAHAVMSASRETGIEPASIWPVADGLGCELLLESNEPFGFLLQVRPEQSSSILRRWTIRNASWCWCRMSRIPAGITCNSC